MKLLTVGSSPKSNIILSSQYVSGYHADVIILDNGDIMICDKNSTNGTFLNGSKLPSGTEVLVRRGDKVVFADTILDWSSIPEVHPDPNAKKLLGIGSHSRNQLHVTGPQVSRFHATIKQANDGKWYICDHSVNGTTINNSRIPKDTYVRLKKGDAIKCAGIPVDNPIPGKKNAGLWYAVAAVLACLLIGGGVWYASTHPKHMSGETIYTKYSPASVLIVMGYHYRISAGSLDPDHTFGSLKECVVSDGDLVPYGSGNSQLCFASGFYISEDGLIATNLHVARPWIFDKNVQPVEDLARERLNRLSKTDNANYANYISQVKVEGIVDYIYAIPHKQYFDGHNAMSCTEVIASDNPEIDVAVLRAMLPGGKLQEGASFINLNTVPDRTAYKPGTKVYTIGFPDATHLQNIEKKTLEAVYAEGYMSQSNNNFDFGHSAKSTEGSSGSPVFNERGQLVGVVSSSYGNGYHFAVRSEFVLQLLEQAQKKNIL